MLFRFGNFTLDTDRRELHAGQSPICVEPQVFDLLELIIRNRDRVVSRDELIESVWKGRIVSESALATRVNAARRAVGDDGARQGLIKTVARRGIRFIGTVEEQAGDAPRRLPAGETRAQTVRSCRTSDGINLAIGVSGSGRMLVKAANWLNHLEYDWESPIFSPLFSRLSERLQLVRYDSRGAGLSDRDVADISLSGFVRDLEAVTDSLDAAPFALLGISQGVATAIAYAVKHPERVSRLILFGGYAQGRNKRGEAGASNEAQALLAMMREGWGKENSAFMRALSTIYFPSGTPEQTKWFAELQRKATTGDLAVRLRLACDEIDVLASLPKVVVPTLVLHGRHDAVAPYAQGRVIAAGIAGAKFITLDMEDHIPLPGSAAWEKAMVAIERFAQGG